MALGSWRGSIRTLVRVLLLLLVGAAGPFAGCTSAPTGEHGRASADGEPVAPVERRAEAETEAESGNERRIIISESAVEPGPSIPGKEDAEPLPTVAASPERFAEAPSPAIKRRSDELLMRRDGRPSWWFDDALESDGRLIICAEALGSSMLEARRAAVEAGRQRLRREFGLARAADLPEETIDRSWTWPLPNSRTLQGNRYAAYVKMSCRDLR